MLNNEFPPLGGGTGTVNLALLREFAKRPDLEIDLITSALGRVAEVEQFSSNIRIYKVPVRNRNIHHSSNRELIEYFFRGTHLSFELLKNCTYDLCFAWSAVPAGAIARLLFSWKRLPYIVRVCGPDIPGFEVRYNRISKLLSPLIRSVWRNAQTVVAKSEGEVAIIAALEQNFRSLIIPNAVDISRFASNVERDISGPLRLLCVGRLIERKGQQYLISAVKKLRDENIGVVLDLVGTGDGEPRLKRQAKRLGLDEVVTFHGYVPRDEIANHYARAHVFVLPSYNEGMSVAMLEAMAAGLPIVTTPTPGTAELVKDGVNGFYFDWGDVEGLTDHLHNLAADRVISLRMGQASRNCLCVTGWNDIAEKYISVFTEVVARGQANKTIGDTCFVRD